jgi:hypothetical protein
MIFLAGTLLGLVIGLIVGIMLSSESESKEDDLIRNDSADKPTRY